MKNIELNFDEERIENLKLVHNYPLFLQLHFRSEWLTAKPVSYEKVIASGQDGITETFHWKDYQVPTLCTPINSQQVLE